MMAMTLNGSKADSGRLDGVPQSGQKFLLQKNCDAMASAHVTCSVGRASMSVTTNDLERSVHVIDASLSGKTQGRELEW